MPLSGLFSPVLHPIPLLAYVVHAALEWAHSLLQSLGLHFQDAKVEGPTTCLEFLGIELDSQTMEAHLPALKLNYLSNLLSQ